MSSSASNSGLVAIVKLKRKELAERLAQIDTQIAALKQQKQELQLEYDTEIAHLIDAQVSILKPIKDEIEDHNKRISKFLRISHTHQNFYQRVKLNVGGTVFETSVDTLLQSAPPPSSSQNDAADHSHHNHNHEPNFFTHLLMQNFHLKHQLKEQALLSPRGNPQQQPFQQENEGPLEFFIDKSPQYFALVLEYLRNSSTGNNNSSNTSLKEEIAQIDRKSVV